MENRNMHTCIDAGYNQQKRVEEKADEKTTKNQ